MKSSIAYVVLFTLMLVKGAAFAYSGAACPTMDRGQGFVCCHVRQTGDNSWIRNDTRRGPNPHFVCQDALRRTSNSCTHNTPFNVRPRSSCHFH